jgi:hypothetical protein
MRKAKRQLADEPPATVDEIRAAIAQLTTGDLLRLRKFAYQRHGVLGRRGAGRRPEDLLSDALAAVLEQRRKWSKSVDFVRFLIGVIQSLSSHLADGKAKDAFDDVVQYVAPDEQTDELRPTDAPSGPTPQEELDAIELDQQIRDHFKNDDHVLTVFDGLCDKMTPAEIRDCGLTTHEFDAAAKRLRRHVRKMYEGGQL